MSLNIKNEHVHSLAREAARRTGKSQTSVIERALEQLLQGLDERDEDAARRRRLSALVAEIRAETTDEARAQTQQLMDEMYDPTGMPA